MLDLRGVYLIDQLRSHPGDTDPYDDTYLPLSGLRFSGSIVGNMGAPLDTFGVGTKTHVRSPSGASSVGASSEWTHWSERDSEETDMETLETSQDPLSVGLYHPVDVELQDTPSAPA